MTALMLILVTAIVLLAAADLFASERQHVAATERRRQAAITECIEWLDVAWEAAQRQDLTAMDDAMAHARTARDRAISHGATREQLIAAAHSRPVIQP